MKIKVLGVGDAYSKENINSSVLVESSDYKILIDCGPTVPFSLWKSIEDWADIDAIYLTHTHPDHVLGLSMLINRMDTLNRKKSLKILSHKDNHKVLKDLIDFGFWPKKQTKNSFVELIEAQDEGSLDLFTYKMVKTVHSVPNRGIYLSDGINSFFMTGDGVLKGDNTKMLTNTTCALLECQNLDIPAQKGHSNFEISKEISLNNKNTLFYLYHIQDDAREEIKRKCLEVPNLSVLEPSQLILL